MIELKFYRDDEYVYINNPDGTTRKVPIEDFESVFDVDTSELPAYTSSDAGKVLTVNNDGTGLEWGESGGGVEIIGPIGAHLSADATITENSAETLLFTNFVDVDTEETVELQNGDLLFLIGCVLSTSALTPTSIKLDASYNGSPACRLTVYNSGRSGDYVISSDELVIIFGVIRKN